MCVAWARSQYQRRVGAFEHGLEIVLQVLAGIRVSGGERGFVWDCPRIRESRMVGRDVVVGDDRKYSAVGITQEVQVVRWNSKDTGRFVRFLHSALRQVP